MSKEINAKARSVIGAHYVRTGQLPTFGEFVDLMGYASHSSAHYVLQQLVAEKFLAKVEDGKRRYAPGPLFVTTPGKTSIPPELMDALPAGNNVKTLVVDEHWQGCEQVCLLPGDLVVVGEVAQVPRDELAVFRRGRTYAVRGEPRRGWMPEGVLLGSYRTHTPRQLRSA